MMRYVILLILSSAFYLNVFSQTAQLNGRVLDSKTLEPLPFANVYVNYTTIGTATDENGYYRLSNVPIGQSEVIFSFVGYQGYQTKINLADGQDSKIIVQLIPDDKMLENVHVKAKRDKVWDRQLKRFKSAFLGTGKGASQCKITNPWVLEFTNDKGTLSAKASENLNIENEALGYRLSYSLKKFITSDDSFSFLGNIRFEEMESANTIIATKWIQNRLTAYYGSQRHLLNAILSHTIREEGFLLYSDKTGFENSPRSSVFARELDHTIEKLDTTLIETVPDASTHGSTIIFKKRLEVHYTKSISSSRIYDDVIIPVSWLELKTGSIKVNSGGTVPNPENMVTSGYMSSLRVADFLPSNYEPQQSSNLIKGRTQPMLSNRRTGLVSPMGQLTGVILSDKTGKPIVGAEIFINKTTTGTESDEVGEFKLNNLPIGQAEIVVYKEGYSIQRSFINIPGGLFNLSLSLTPIRNKKFVPLTDREIAWLQNEFINPKIDSLSPMILNLGDIGTIENESQMTFNCKSPLIVINNLIGYRQKFFIMGVPADKIADAPVKYEYLPSTSFIQVMDREKNHKKYFNGSLRHWLLSLINEDTNQIGYSLFDNKGKQIDPTSLLSSHSQSDYFRLNVHSRLMVCYLQKDHSIDTSYVTINEAANINRDGNVINSKTLKIDGNIARTDGLANRLPNDYRPISSEVEEGFAEMFRRSYEKVYLHTDKPYYYPGERIWFKAYMNYYFQPSRDELSRTLYVELINPIKEVIIEKTLKLDSGFAFNDFILPDSLKYGDYYLRAYTQLQRNFGDENLFIKALPVLKITTKPLSANKKEEAGTTRLQVTSDKKTYTTRDKVTLTIGFKDNDKNPTPGNFSLSVTDASQVLFIPEGDGTIIDRFPIRRDEISEIPNLTFLTEYGISIKGKFSNNQGNGEKTILNIVQIRPYQLAFVDTDVEGYFQLRNLDFYDQAPFTINSATGKGKPYGKTSILKRDVPPIEINQDEYQITVTDAETTQRIFSEYEKPSDAIKLEDVNVLSKQDAEYIKSISSTNYSINHSLEDGEYIFNQPKQFQNLLYTLRALNISGLIVNPTERTIHFAIYSKPSTMNLRDDAAREFAETFTPMVTLDGVPLIGSAGEALSRIDPSKVESIEVTKSPRKIRGTLAPHGVISVFTKAGASDKPLLIGLKLFKLHGYSVIDKFNGPDYKSLKVDKTLTDYRSTLYWNPNFKINKSIGASSQLSFYTSDLSGRYRILVEGVDGAGNPVRSLSFIEVSR